MQRSVLVLLLVALAVVVSHSADFGVETPFPEPRFNGLQIAYTIGGAALGTPSDGGPFEGWVRTYTGTLQGETLRISGSVLAFPPPGKEFPCRATISVWAGDQKANVDIDLAGTDPRSDVQKPFDISVKIPRGATSGGVTATVNGVFRNGEERFVTVTGSFTAGPPGTTPPPPDPVSPQAVHRDRLTVPRVGLLHFIRGAAELDGRPLGEADRPFEYGKTLETGANTRVVITFTDGSKFLIKSDTKVTIDGPNYGGGVGACLKLETGSAVFYFIKQGKAFQVVTPTSLCGALGTVFAIRTSADGTTFAAVKQGKVWFSDRAGKKKVTISAGYYSMIRKGKAPSKPKTLSKKESDSFFGDAGLLDSVPSPPKAETPEDGQVAPASAPAPGPAAGPALPTDAGCVRDEAAMLDADTTLELSLALSILREARGLPLAVVFVKPPSSREEAARLAGEHRTKLMAAGVLPPECGLLLFASEDVRGYSRSVEFDKRVPMAVVKQTWDEAAQVQGLAHRVAAQLRSIYRLTEGEG